MTNEEIKNHPMFGMMSLAMGEEKALRMVKEALEEEAKKNQAKTEFSHKEKKIIIPASMNKKQAAEELSRQWKDEESIIEVDRHFESWNWKDVLVAVKKAAEEHFGWVQGKTKETFFGKSYPSEIEVVVDIKDGKKITESCFYGDFTASVWEDADVHVGAGYISTTVKKRYTQEVKDFYDLVQTILDTKSIYRGKSITVTKERNPWGEDSLNFEVFELKVSQKIILNDDIERIVQNFIIDDLGDEGKRCYLFSGKYGNAKTETAMRIGKAGNLRGMAYFYCKDADVFHMLLKQAINYQPCIVFLEDVDEIASGDARDADMNRILNTLDGVQTKGNNLTVIFTTNHEKRISPPLRRPGRIDLVVNFENPDKKAIASIYKCYLSEVDTKNELDYDKLAANTPDCPGAVIAEIAKRALKLCKRQGVVKEEFVIASLDSMKHHLKLMSEAVEKPAKGKMVIAVEGAVVYKDEESKEASLKNNVSAN